MLLEKSNLLIHQECVGIQGSHQTPSNAESI